MKTLLSIFIIMIFLTIQPVASAESCAELSTSEIKENLTHYCTVTSDTKRSVCRKIKDLITSKGQKEVYEACKKIKLEYKEGSDSTCTTPNSIEGIKTKLLSSLGENFKEGKVVLCSNLIPRGKGQRFECIDKENSAEVTCWKKSKPWDALTDLTNHSLLNEKYMANISDINRSEAKDVIGYGNERRNGNYGYGSRVSSK